MIKTHCKHGHELTPKNTYIRPDNKNRSCIKCIRKRSKDFHKTHPYNEPKEQKRNRMLKHRYGITTEDFNKMYKNQNGRCAVCNNLIPNSGKGVNVDHNHKTRKVRGLLCTGCNIFVGYIENKHLLIPNIIEYIGMLNQ